MTTHPEETSQNRKVFILRLWPKPSQGSWIIEIQDVNTGRIIHLNDLEALADSLRAEINCPEAAQDQPG
jgi:subtilisin-like proprotein convertase family protein